MARKAVIRSTAIGNGGMPDLYLFLPTRLVKASRLHTEFLEQRLCLFEVLCVEAFGEPAVDGGEKIAAFGTTALVAAQPGEAHGGAQFPELGLLLRGDAQGFAIQFLGGIGVPWCSSNWPLCLFSSAANQRSPVLSAICKASSNRFNASSTCPAIAHALERRAI